MTLNNGTPVSSAGQFQGLLRCASTDLLDVLVQKPVTGRLGAVNAVCQKCLQVRLHSVWACRTRSSSVDVWMTCCCLHNSILASSFLRHMPMTPDHLQIGVPDCEYCHPRVFACFAERALDL